MDLGIWRQRFKTAYKVGAGRTAVGIWRLVSNAVTRRRFASAGRGSKFGVRIAVDGPVHVGDYTVVESDVVFRGGPVVIGSHTYIGHHTLLNTVNQIKIGDHTFIAGFCYLVDADHGVELGKLIQEQPLVGAPISIGNDVWLGAHVVVLPGTVIEDGAVIGANSVVSGHIPANAIAVGAPARVVKMRT